LSDSVTFVGNLSEKQMIDYYRSLDVFCYTGSPECGGGATASLSVIEAQACGVPVIRSVGNNDEIIDNTTGYAVNPNKDTAVAEAIIRFNKLTGHSRTAMKNNARKYVLKYFSWNKSVSTLNRLIKTLGNN